MIKSRYNNMRFGTILGLILPLLTLVGFILFSNYGETFQDFFDITIRFEIFSKILSLCALPNLLLFFIFIWRNYLYSARGVVLATIIFAVSSLLLKALL